MVAILYAYAVGTDLDDVAPRIEARLDELVAERTWRAREVRVVNQRATAAEWDLGLNITLPASPKRNVGWLEDLAVVAEVFAALRRDTGRTFVIGVQQGKGAARDVFTVDGDSPDQGALRDALLAAVC